MNRPLRSMLVVGCLILASACASPSPPPPADTQADDARIEHEATRLIGEHPGFVSPVTVELYAQLLSPTAELLAEGGYVELTPQAKQRFRLTPLGQRVLVKQTEYEEDKPVYTVALSRRELIRIDGVTDLDGSQIRVDFLYRPVLTEAGDALAAAGSTLREIRDQAPRPGTVWLAAGDEGWQIRRLRL